MTPVEPAVVELGPVDKTFRSFVPDQAWLVPPSLDDWLPQDHFAWFIADLVDECLDLSAFYADYTEGRGAPPFDPRLMVRVLLLWRSGGIACAQGAHNPGSDAGQCAQPGKKTPPAPPIAVRAGPRRPWILGARTPRPKRLCVRGPGQGTAGA